MDYLLSEVRLYDWDDYDKAALVFAYSSGGSMATAGYNYLYCTDEHRGLTHMAFHQGSTPTELSIV